MGPARFLSRHMTNNNEILNDYIHYDEPVKIYLGDERFVLSYGKGKLRLRVIHPSGIYIALSEVLFVPQLYKNLLSVPSMTTQGAEVCFIGNKCLVVKNGKTAQIGHSVNGGLYKLNSPIIPSSSETAAYATTEASISVWHQRYGHLNMKDLTSIVKDKVVDGLITSENKSELSDDCEACALGKMHRLPYPKQSTYKSKSLLKIIHTDLCGPIHTVDTYSHS